ncbi:MAG: alpha/beta hydrolase [Bacteroides sp.]|nr:alpha/beta hydrolase [Prevotella sp.]MCM1408711.1 alpha/beta hydrolase [Treponema brennaborense]MCM1470626.1 alpha/beta hydrolase [Bacteroides sp.]
MITEHTTVGEIKSIKEFKDFGRLLFPVNRGVSDSMTLKDVSTSSVYVWYSNISVQKTIEIIAHLKEHAEKGEQVFFPIYSEKEMQLDKNKQNTGLFFFQGKEGNPFAIVNAGGGFMYVGAMHDSFPHALELSKNGYNAFALIYRPDSPYEDSARTISFIHDNAKKLGVSENEYSLWGGSAGARMAAVLGNKTALFNLTGRTDIPQAQAVIMQYTGYSSVSEYDAPTYACVGTSDGIASRQTMESRLANLKRMGIPTEFHAYQGLSHGFGLGTGTAAEGWIKDAINFWEEQRK